MSFIVIVARIERSKDDISIQCSQHLTLIDDAEDAESGCRLPCFGNAIDDVFECRDIEIIVADT